jgi:hypothetical protein
MQLVIDFIFYLYAYSTCFERHALIIRSPLTLYTASSFLCWCLLAALSCKKLAFCGASLCIDRMVRSVCQKYTPDQPINKRQTHLTNRTIQTDAPIKVSFLQESAADKYQHKKLEAACTVKGLLMMSAWHSKHIEYTYRYKIKSITSCICWSNYWTIQGCTDP